MLTSSDLLIATDADGKRMPASAQWRDPDLTAIHGHLVFPARGRINGKPGPSRPAKVVWNIPVEVQDVLITVEFRGLPLP